MFYILLMLIDKWHDGKYKSGNWTEVITLSK